MYEGTRAIIFDKQVVFISTDYRVQIVTSDRKTQEKEVSLEVSIENQLTWSQKKGFAYTFTLNSEGKCFLTKSSLKGGGSGPIGVLFHYEREVFTWTEIRSGCKYIFTPIQEPIEHLLYSID